MLSLHSIRNLVSQGRKLSWATKNYPSRGQTAVQELFQTPKGKLFLKRSSKQNHIDCQIEIKSGTIAQREYWAHCLAKELALRVPDLWLLDDFTTVQVWFDLPDARQYATSQGKMLLEAETVFNCALFDWLTGQIDRHDANYLYDYVNQSIVLIDSAHCFLKYTGSIPDYLRYFEIGYPRELRKDRSTTTRDRLQSLTTEKLATIATLRNTEESWALHQRLEQLKPIKTIQGIINLYRGVRP